MRSWERRAVAVAAQCAWRAAAGRDRVRPVRDPLAEGVRVAAGLLPDSRWPGRPHCRPSPPSRIQPITRSGMGHDDPGAGPPTFNPTGLQIALPRGAAERHQYGLVIHRNTSLLADASLRTNNRLTRTALHIAGHMARISRFFRRLSIVRRLRSGSFRVRT